MRMPSEKLWGFIAAGWLVSRATTMAGAAVLALAILPTLMPFFLVRALLALLKITEGNAQYVLEACAMWVELSDAFILAQSRGSILPGRLGVPVWEDAQEPDLLAVFNLERPLSLRKTVTVHGELGLVIWVTYLGRKVS